MDKFQYVFENGELLVSDSNPPNQMINSEEYGEVVYTSGSQTILLHSGEYYIQTDGETLLVGNERDDVETESSSFPEQSEDVVQYLDEEPVVYKFIQNEEPVRKKIKLESQSDEAEIVSFDVEKHLRILEDQEGLTGSAARYQYAVLQDGKLHLRLCEANSVEILDDLTENEDEPNPEAAEGVVDLSKVTGRNLITGQTVTLDDYLERIHSKMAAGTDSPDSDSQGSSSKTFLNRKFTIGKTIAGKKLVGKIVDIKTGAAGSTCNENDESQTSELPVIIAEDDVSETPATLSEVSEPEDANVNVQELVFDSTGKIIKVTDAREVQFNEGATAEHLEFLSKTLSGLADMEVLRKKIIDKELRVKFVEKRFENKTQSFRKTVTHLKGYLVVHEQEDPVLVPLKSEYLFVLNNDDEEDARVKFGDWTSLSVVLAQDRTGHKTTRVNFYEKSDGSNVCKLCAREFKSGGHLNRHLSTSHSDKSLTCHVCQIKFGDQSLLNKHRRYHEHYFACANCGKNFTTQSSLRRHLSVHDHSLRPLECTICNARFTDESSLCKHLIIHTGIRAYHCGTCQKAFTTVGDLNFHRRVHDPVKMFYCDVCGREFSRHSNLLRHTEIHKGAGDLFKCGVCGCSYKFISSLTRHVVQNHMSQT